MPRIAYVIGVSRWFTLLLHHWSIRACRRSGHQPGVVLVLVRMSDQAAEMVVCHHCGQILHD